ncbi:serine hydrolase [Streptosporangium roseum]|uniref:Beta-lactamase n=1 Tax=Streptosporangium roseum (strain ATCC 12428 / DSM 43021 / JCM 3005 / KCTC 9067 / NCIMB 10171 / NRRL 2505 / NI 9100) TaxID=479432 RepID=D2ARC0_STRRD|nr:serine hydrolase [Streptosporangium roseum]ACZ88461.1 beta-lactamase [Streptosporangium roseum DSM 43021]
MCEALREAFDDADVEGFIHVRDVDGDAETGLGADEPVVLASVFKVPIVLEYARQAAAGTLERTERLTVTAADKDGGIGTSGCADDVSLTLRDLAHFMMTMSDNAATDVLLRRVGLGNLHATLRGLGLERTRLIGGCAELLGSAVTELGLSGGHGIFDEEELAGVSEERIRALSILDPERTTSGTPRETTTLLTRIWRDEAGPPEACAEVRRIMGNQIWPHRLSSGFGDEVKVSGKTGTLWGVRNEAGVVEYPDGRRYAVAVFLRTGSLGLRLPRADRVIGHAARVAIDHLRE